ncbi:MAG: DUF1990 domain-containing protein [Lewinellaceae bacterium]|nr:DUF1990 domain-containing protein [Saprospiraceae bacterium]MCB9334337.1 DUF1990 domain-containing protein [Lewinellaceae bacterium]
MLTIKQPTIAATENFLQVQRDLPFTYPHLEGTKLPDQYADFDNDLLRVCIGRGAVDFERAKMAIRAWQMFPAGWTKILPENAPLEPGTTVAMYAQFLGFWWRNACRIVYVVDAPDRFGFAYGTLPGHVESGEELFLVELQSDGTVWYVLRAFSRPRHWVARFGYPLVRLLQARFRRDSARQMQAFVHENSDR